MDKTCIMKKTRRDKQNIKIQTSNNTHGLLRQMDTQQTLDARSFEIKSMEDALKNSSQFSGASRVFQQLPRHMRRRAASYNVKRIPWRSRERARAQMLRDPKMQIKSPRRKKMRRPRISSKMWLGTHIWHAKRMRIKTMWGFKLAMRKTLKSGRFIYRTGRQGCTLYDASYLKPIQLEGSFEIICNVLKSICDPYIAGPCSQKYVRGNRHGQTLVYNGVELLGPISFLWNPNQQMIWIWAHPSIFQQVVDLMKADPLEITFPSLSRYELRGPKAFEILSKTLDLVKKSHPWLNAAAPDALDVLGPNIVVAMDIYDPRLRFPISKSFVQPQTPGVVTPCFESNIWDQHRVIKQTESSMNKRRSSNLVPGPLEPTPADSIIPLMLLKQSNSPGWDIIFNSDWSMELWNTFVYAGAVAIGMYDRHHNNFENRILTFPFDFPGTNAYRDCKDQEYADKIAKYNATPPGKRAKEPIKEEFNGELVFSGLNPRIDGYIPLFFPQLPKSADHVCFKVHLFDTGRHAGRYFHDC